jgi:hypothetical protein
MRPVEVQVVPLHDIVIRVSGGIPPAFLNFGIKRRKVVSFTLRPLTPVERAPGMH